MAGENQLQSQQLHHITEDVKVSIKDNVISLTSSDHLLPLIFQYQKSEPVYDYKTKGFVYRYVTRSLYERSRTGRDGSVTIKFKMGWGCLLLNMLKDRISLDDRKLILDTVYSESSRSVPFSNLRDYQNDDILHLLKYKYGIFQCYTGYGKSEIIATLVNYILDETNDKVLLLVPSKKCKDEIVKRCKEKFNVDVPGDRISLIVTTGVTSSKRFNDPELIDETRKEMESYQWILSDEVEYSVNRGGITVLEMCKNATRKYGFSATADKIGGEQVTFSNGVTDVVTNNSTLIGYFGQAIIYRVPTHLSINMVYINTNTLNRIRFNGSDMSSDNNVYINVIRKIWMDDSVCELITSMISYYPMLFIPINDLNEVIDNWISKWWIDKYNILLICGEGYKYYPSINNSKFRSRITESNNINLSLTEAWEVINEGLVDVIPSTSSGYRALDLPGLKNILLIQGKIAGVYIQSIGRVARGSEVNIISLSPSPYKTIPVYTKGMVLRDKSIRNLYRYCKINDIIRYETEFQQSH